MTKTFFSKTKAEQFASIIRSQGFEKVEVWNDRDAFNQNIYIVKWF